MGSTGTPIVASSTLMLAQLISETYLSGVAFGLRRASAKARRRDDAQPSIHPVGEEILEEGCNQTAPVRLREPRAQRCPTVFGDLQHPALDIEMRPQLRQFFVPHQHDEMYFRQRFRVLRQRPSSRAQLQGADRAAGIRPA